ncbi:MAG: TetR/AcrR family transcriptional regulator [Gemmatimonadales bacterium]
MAKGTETRNRIVEQALKDASLFGLNGITLGELAGRLGISKSGLFAHFGSKEELQLRVIEAAEQKFKAEVIAPALKAPRGEPRVKALFEQWIAWGDTHDLPGGCVFSHAAMEMDDAPGPARNALVKVHQSWLAFLEEAARNAIREGHFRPDLDVSLFAFQLTGIVAGYYRASRLLHDANAHRHAMAAYEMVVERSVGGRSKV